MEGMANLHEARTCHATRSQKKSATYYIVHISDVKEITAKKEHGFLNHIFIGEQS
jgi:hypothetical protein